MEAVFLDFIITGFGGAFCIVWAIGMLLSGERRPHWQAVFFVAVSGFRLSWEAFFLSGAAAQAPAFYGLFLPFMYVIGPVIFQYYRKLADFPMTRLWPHAIPFACASIIVIPWLFAESEIQAELVRGLGALSPAERTAADWLMMLWVIGPKLSILGYSLWLVCMRSGEGMQAIASLNSEVRWFARILLVYIWIMIIADIAGYLAFVPELYRYSAWSHAIAAVLVYWFSRREPQALLELQAAVQRTRYERSKLGNVDPDAALRELDRLMREERLYADEDLRLPGLARACGLTPHQLSELLNVRLGLNFASYVNRHRVEAAKITLREEPGRTILSVALAVGFNSKSAFHRHFARYVGETPRAYRQRASGSPGI